MTAKRFKLRLSKLGNGMITDTQKRDDLYFDKEFLDATLPKANKWLNELAEENEQLKSFKDRVFNLIADEIKEENKLLDYYTKEKAQYNADRQQTIIGVLKRLQKELEE